MYETLIMILFFINLVSLEKTWLISNIELHFWGH